MGSDAGGSRSRKAEEERIVAVRVQRWPSRPNDRSGRLFERAAPTNGDVGFAVRGCRETFCAVVMMAAVPMVDHAFDTMMVRMVSIA